MEMLKTFYEIHIFRNVSLKIYLKHLLRRDVWDCVNPSNYNILNVSFQPLIRKMYLENSHKINNC